MHCYTKNIRLLITSALKTNMASLCLCLHSHDHINVSVFSARNRFRSGMHGRLYLNKMFFCYLMTGSYLTFGRYGGLKEALGLMHKIALWSTVVQKQVVPIRLQWAHTILPCATDLPDIWPSTCWPNIMLLPWTLTLDIHWVDSPLTPGWCHRQSRVA